MEIDRRAFVSSLGGAAAVALLTPDQKADALEHYMEEQLAGNRRAELRKGVSVQVKLATQGNRLLLAGGNQVSPAGYDLDTGECLAAALTQGQPKSNNGQFVGTFRGEHAIVGGRILFFDEGDAIEFACPGLDVQRAVVIEVQILQQFAGKSGHQQMRDVVTVLEIQFVASAVQQEIRGRRTRNIEGVFRH